MSSDIEAIGLYNTFILKSKYHEGKFIIFEQDRYWYGHINALHTSHELSKILLGSKLGDFVIADLGLGIYDSYQVTQIAHAPVYYQRPDSVINPNLKTTHRERWLDGAREKIFIRGKIPETTLSLLYGEIKKSTKTIRLRDLRKPIDTVTVQNGAGASTTAKSFPLTPSVLDYGLTRATNILEITELKLRMAIRGKDTFLIALALVEAEKVAGQIDNKYRETDRYKSLLRRCVEAKNLMNQDPS
jgi:hypothetical protein